jgi:hypothetical protein
MPGGDMGGGIDSLGGPEGGDVGGAEESMDMGGAPAADAGEPVAEARRAKKNLITELYTHKKKDYVPYFDQYMNKLLKEEREENSLGRVETISDTFVINEELNSIVKELDNVISEGSLNEEASKAEFPTLDIGSILED